MQQQHFFSQRQSTASGNPNPPTLMPTPEQIAEVPLAIRDHHQLNGDFCAVSGFESIAKLHGLLAGNAFPLQSDATNEQKGFEPAHYTYLTERGFTCSDQHIGTGTAAAQIIQQETDAGRFPLASIPWQKGGRWGYHVFLFARHEDQVLWIDPAEPCVMLRGIDAIPVALENNRTRNPIEGRTIHMLTYTRPN
jgi:hypothetical protein